jgi:hypothetical protein
MSATDSAAPPAPPPGAHTVHVVHPAPSRFAGLGAVVLLLGLVVVGGIAVLFFWSMNQNKQLPTLVSSAGEQGDMSALRDRLASDEARLAVMERSGPGDVSALKSSFDQQQSDLASLSARVGKLETAPDPQATARLDDLDRRLAAMRADYDLRVAALERNALGSDLPQRLATLASAEAAAEARIAHLEAIDPAVTMRHAAAELALANLVRASGTPGPFAAELQTFRTLMPNAPEASELVPIAPRGAPTQETLAEEFSGMAAKALAAENAGKAHSWLGRLWANVGNIIVIRRIGDAKGADSESILARAGARLNQGDLDGAIAEMKALKGTARDSAQAWLDQAQARQAIAHDTSALAVRLAPLLATP